MLQRSWYADLDALSVMASWVRIIFLRGKELPKASLESFIYLVPFSISLVFSVYFNKLEKAKISPKSSLIGREISLSRKVKIINFTSMCSRLFYLKWLEREMCFQVLKTKYIVE